MRGGAVAVQIRSAGATELFVGTEAEPRQVLRIVLQRAVTDGAVTVSLLGDLVRGQLTVAAGDGEGGAELPMAVDAAGAPRDVATRTLPVIGPRRRGPGAPPGPGT